MSVNLPFEKTTDTFDGIYRGKIVDNNDPSKLGRVKAEIYPMLEGISADLLPWAVPATSISTGSGNGYGTFSVPKVGTFVFLFFEAGNIYSPVYFAEAPTGIHGIPPASATNYPDRHVVRYSSGIEMYIDDSAKEIKVTHPTSGYIIINSGGVTVNSTGAVNIVGSTVSINP